MKLFLQLLILMPWRIPGFIYHEIRYRVEFFCAKRVFSKRIKSVALLEKANELFSQNRDREAFEILRRALRIMDETTKSRAMKALEGTWIDIWARERGK